MNGNLLPGYTFRELTMEAFSAVYREREALYFTASTRDDIDGETQQLRKGPTDCT